MTNTATFIATCIALCTWSFVVAKHVPGNTPIQLTEPPIVTNLISQLSSCPPLPPRQTPPTNVHDLRPDDFSVVMAMGDSIVCGLNTRFKHDTVFSDPKFRKTVPQVEFRGTNFATGGDPDTFSLSRIISTYRERNGLNAVNGMSHGNRTMEFCYGPICPSGSSWQPFYGHIMGFDAAQAGSWATKSNILNQLWYFDLNKKNLVNKKSDAQPWKLLIYEHGFNNLCLGCKRLSRAFMNPNKYEKAVRFMIDELRERYKNMVVVLTAPFQLSQVYNMIQRDPVCKQIQSHRGFFDTCPCVFKDVEKNHPFIDNLAHEYNTILAQIAADYRQKGWTDFAVVYDQGLGQLDLTHANAEDIVSGYDCFHPTMNAHAHFATSLWNNLFRKEQDKQPYATGTNVTLCCPTADDRIVLD